LNSPAVETIETAENPDEASLARDIIAVHGAEAAVVARGNARAAALAGQGVAARSWIRVLAIIQRRQRTSPPRRPENAPRRPTEG
jgi:hypothetical protein